LVKYARTANTPAIPPHKGCRIAFVEQDHDATMKATIRASMIAARSYITYT
jgi:hypothetical protein